MNRLRTLISRLLGVVVLTMLGGSARADVPDLLEFNVWLASSNEMPVDGSVVLTFRIFDAASAGQLLYEEIQLNQSIETGGMQALVGQGIVTASGAFTILDERVFEGPERYLEVVVNSEVLTPRFPMHAAALALRTREALDADALDGRPAEAYLWRVADACPDGASIREISPAGQIQCEADDGEFLNAGLGLALTGDTFSIDLAAVQPRISGACPPGSFIRAIDSASVVCEPDDDTNTLYTAGNGLELVGTELRVDLAYVQARVGTVCPSERVMTAIDARGTATCTTVPEGDVDSIKAGFGLNGGCTAGDCALVLDWTRVQQRISGTCGIFGMIRVGETGNPTCIPVHIGDIEGLTTALDSGLEGGCEAGNCALRANFDLVQKRPTNVCPSGTVARALSTTGAVSCRGAGTGDVTAVVTGPTSGLSGGCTTGTCILSLDMAGFSRSPNLRVGVSSSNFPLAPGARTVLSSSFTAPAGASGRVIALATGRFICFSGSCPGVYTIYSELTTSTGTFGTATAAVTNMFSNLRSMVALTEVFSVNAGQSLTVYWRAAAAFPTTGNPLIANPNLSLVFIPN